MKTELEINVISKKEIYNITTTCRACLKENIDNTISLFSNEDSVLICDKLMLCTSIEVDEKDGLPNVICEQCFQELDAADTFRIKCQNSDSVLRKLCLQINLKQSNTDVNALSNHHDVKEEPSDDNETLQVDYFETESIKDEDVINMEESNLETESGSGKKKSFLRRKTKDGKQGGNLVCAYCDKTVQNGERGLEKHIQIMHNATDGGKWRITGRGADRRLYCGECNYSCRRKQIMVNHYRRHTGERPYVCEVCSKTFALMSSFINHTRGHSDITYYTCSHCGKQFKIRTAFTRHQLVHSTEKKFSCELCNKGFKTKFTYNSHMNRHSNIKNYSCEVCGYTFVTNGELITHRTKHREDSLLKCELCKFQTKRKHRMKEHVARHMGTLPFQCSYCLKAFYYRWELVEHIRTHTKEKIFPCPECGIKLGHRSNVRKHMLKVHGLKKEIDRRVIK